MPVENDTSSWLAHIFRPFNDRDEQELADELLQAKDSPSMQGMFAIIT